MNDYNFSIEPWLDGRKTIIDNERWYQIQDNCYPQNTIENDQIRASYLCEGNLSLNHFSSLLPFKNSLIKDIKLKIIISFIRDYENPQILIFNIYHLYFIADFCWTWEEPAWSFIEPNS